MASLDLADAVPLARSLVDVPSVSGLEGELADAVEAALRACPHLTVRRDGDAIVASTTLAAAERVIVAGHLDTVPIAGNVPSRIERDSGVEYLWGRGSVDMKSGVAVMLALAARPSPNRDVTWIFYDHEEVESAKSGLGRLLANHREWIDGDFAVLCEPTDGRLEGGCNGTIRFDLATTGVTAHSARSWLGHNAIHDMAQALESLNRLSPRTIEVDGLAYREGVNAVAIAGGIAGNVIPDRCVLTVNYRFAPDKTPAEAIHLMRSLFDGYDLVVTDAAAGARPGLGHPAAAAFADAVRAAGCGEPRAKLGWTDVARFAELGIPAVNFGPGDPGLCHTDDERCPTEQIRACRDILAAWLGLT